MPSDYTFHCGQCGWTGERYRNLKVCPRCRSRMNLKRITEAPRPKIICLSGSTRFREAFFSEYARLSDEGNIVLTVNRLIPQHDDLTEAQITNAHELHLRKIDLCDEVRFLNVGGYIGRSGFDEIQYAKKVGKPITYLEPIKRQASNSCEAMAMD